MCAAMCVTVSSFVVGVVICLLIMGAGDLIQVFVFTRHDKHVYIYVYRSLLATEISLQPFIILFCRGEAETRRICLTQRHRNPGCGCIALALSLHLLH